MNIHREQRQRVTRYSLTCHQIASSGAHRMCVMAHSTAFAHFFGELSWQQTSLFPCKFTAPPPPSSVSHLWTALDSSFRLSLCNVYLEFSRQGRSQGYGSKQDNNRRKGGKSRKEKGRKTEEMDRGGKSNESTGNCCSMGKLQLPTSEFPSVYVVYYVGIPRQLIMQVLQQGIERSEYLSASQVGIATPYLY